MDRSTRRTWQILETGGDEETPAPKERSESTPATAHEDFPNNFVSLDDSYLQTMFSSGRSVTKEPEVPSTSTTGANVVNPEKIIADMTSTFATLMMKLTNSLKPASSKPDLVTCYNGLAEEDPLQFIEQIEEHFILGNISDDREQVMIVNKHLQGEARRWAEHYRNVPLTYLTLKNRFLQRFNAPSEIAPAMVKLFGEHQRSGEPVDTFLSIKNMLFNRLAKDMNMETRIEILLELLLPELASRVRAVRPRSIEEMLQFATKFEKDVMREQSARNTGSTSGLNRNTGQSSYQNRGGASTPNTPCRFCSAMHFNRECPRNPNRQGLNENTVGGRRVVGPPSAEVTTTSRPTASREMPRPAGGSQQ